MKNKKHILKNERTEKLKNKKGASVLAKAQKKHIRISPRKLRLVTNAVKNLSPQEALSKLKFINKKGARILAEVLKQAIDNAKTLKPEAESLKFKKIIVDEGPRFKRRDKSHGARFDPGVIQKRTAHLKIVLERRERGTKN